MPLWHIKCLDNVEVFDMLLWNNLFRFLWYYLYIFLLRIYYYLCRLSKINCWVTLSFQNVFECSELQYLFVSCRDKSELEDLDCYVTRSYSGYIQCNYAIHLSYLLLHQQSFTPEFESLVNNYYRRLNT